MNDSMIGILLGGVAAAILLGVSGTFQKSSNLAGIGTGPYLVVTGLAVVAVGLIWQTILYASGILGIIVGALASRMGNPGRPANGVAGR